MNRRAILGNATTTRSSFGFSDAAADDYEPDAPMVTVHAAPEIRYWLEASADFKRWSELPDYPTNGVQTVYPNKATWFDGKRSFFRIRYDSAP